MVLAHPQRQGAPKRHGKRLATDLIVCGLCGHEMRTTTRSGVRYYSCPTYPTGCGRVHVHADHLDRWLLDRLLEHLDEPGPEPKPVAAALDVSKAMDELARDYYVDRLLSRHEFLAARARLVRQAEAISQKSGRQPEVARILASADPRRKLGDTPVVLQRQLLGRYLDRLVVNRTVDRQRRFNPARFECHWSNAET